MLFLEVEIQTGPGNESQLKLIRLMVFRSMNRYRRAPNHRYLYRRHLNSPFPSEVANIYQYGYIAKYFQTLGREGANGVALLDRGKEGLKRFARNAKHSCTTITRLMYTELMRVHRNIRHGTRGR